MVFSSIPAYLDPSNWQQQPTHQTGNNSINPQFPLPPPQSQPPPPPPPPPHVGGGPGSASIRPGSMADRARMANIPMPDTALKCPRCESTNTKFCYFNNYSLSQPRHFCKACRRYWTRGGALRSVPVGGGCRRNKRSKASSSKSPVSSDRQTASGSASMVSSSSGAANMLGLTPQIQSLRYMAPFGQFSDYAGAGDIGLNYSGISPSVAATSEMNFQMGANFLGGGGGGGGVASLFSTGGIEQWRLQQPQQFPFMGGFDPSPGLFPFQGGGETSGYGGETSQVRPKWTASMLSQLTSVKTEGNQESNLSRQFMGIPGNDQWSGSAWTDLSSFSSSSTSNPL
ncbi:unnamed protein product [Ilex paraguariensis]|uniref:Dof zinc finger protein n=1 Tax=Ilex paraguariensis TaxID=185542 RepID=A0ABC8UTE1_9AQUA